MERNSSLPICRIFGYSQVGLSIQKIKETTRSFNIAADNGHYQIQCPMPIANTSKNSDTLIKQCANDKLI